VKLNGQPAVNGCTNGVKIHVEEIDQYDANVTVRIGHVLLSSHKAWGAHSAPGWLMNVILETHAQQEGSGHPSICAVQPHGNNAFPQITMHDSLFDAADYEVRAHPEPLTAFVSSSFGFV